MSALLGALRRRGESSKTHQYDVCYAADSSSIRRNQFKTDRCEPNGTAEKPHTHSVSLTSQANSHSFASPNQAKPRSVAFEGPPNAYSVAFASCVGTHSISAFHKSCDAFSFDFCKCEFECEFECEFKCELKCLYEWKFKWEWENEFKRQFKYKY